MFCKIKIKNKEYNCYYDTNNHIEKDPIVLLHGWGVDSSIYKNITKDLDYYVITMDFIGFGKSDKPEEPLNLDDYVIQLEQFIEHLKLKNVILLGHSFGGRVAIKYNYYYNLNNLILVDAAGIRHKSLKLYEKILKYKILKKWYFLFDKVKYKKLVNTSGSRDYKLLSPVMKQTMSNVVKEDLKKYCTKTRTNTLLLWGVNDEETPLTDSYVYHKLFYKSRLVIFYKSGHFPFLDEKDKFIRIINSGINA